MTYPYSVDPDRKRIRISDDSGIDAGRLIAFAQSLDSEYLVCFEMGGRRFGVDRSGTEIILIPEVRE